MDEYRDILPMVGALGQQYLTYTLSYRVTVYRRLNTARINHEST